MMNTVKITTTQNVELEYDLASLGERMVGTIVDILLLGAFSVIFFTVFLGVVNNYDDWLVFPFFITIFLYDLISEVFMNGQTVGKRVMKIKVISLTGVQPTLGQYIIRWLFRPIDFYFTGGLCALVSVAISERKQRLGDIVAGTTLIKTIPRTDFQQTIYTPAVESGYTVSFPEVANLTDTEMQLVKEVIISVNRTGNITLAAQASEKIKRTLHIQSNLEPLNFLHVLLSDYNFLTSRV